ncbi:phosphohydrolase, partial [Kitasatospora sp. NPDC048296]
LPHATRDSAAAPARSHPRGVDRECPTAGWNFITEELARFARNHASWNAPGISTDDLLVSLADKIWKGKRVTDLEQLLIERLCETGRQQPWEAFAALDDVLDHIAQDAERRLTFQAEHPVAPGIG